MTHLTFASVTNVVVGGNTGGARAVRQSGKVLKAEQPTYHSAVRAAAPAPLTTFVGRRRELQTLQRLLSTTRLITLVGPGGCGKTRLANELTRRANPSEVAWVNLALLQRAADVGHEVALCLGIASADPLTDGFAARAGETPRLVMLDNCEHLLNATAEIAVKVLSANPHIRVLATSREPLDIEGELVWRVPSLSLPDPLDANDPPRCARADAVKLFVERARFAQPGFVLNAETCESVAAICRAVDGIPLAIELAAARLRHATIGELASRLDDLLELLVGTRRGGDPRHRTLRAALDWSHALLDPSEQEVFRRVAVFAGGFTIDSAEATCADAHTPDSEVLSVLASLVDKSLIVPPSDVGRYRLLEPIREYALEHLRANTEEDRTLERCASYLVELVIAQIPDPMGMGPSAVVRRIAGEFTNLTAILPWLVRNRPADAARVLGRFAQNHWGLTRTHLAVLTEWLDRSLEAHPRRDAARVEGLLGKVQVVLRLRHDPRGRPLVDEALSIATELGDEALQARALSRSAFVACWDDPARAMREYDEAIPTLRCGHLGALALALAGRAFLRQQSGDATGAEADVTESLAAWERHAGSNSLSRALTLIAAADVAFQAGNVALAETRLHEAVELERYDEDTRAQDVGLAVAPIEFLAHLAAARGDNDRALRLAGFADRVRDETGVWPRPWFALTDRRWLGELEQRLGTRARSLRAEGRRLSVTNALAYAKGVRVAGALSPRELGVIALVADGLTNKEIAARLSISERTAESHVLRIRAKLRLHSRAQIGRWASDNLAVSQA